MHARLVSFFCEDAPDWPNWAPGTPADEYLEFELTVGTDVGPGTNLFFLTIVSPVVLDVVFDKNEFKGVIIDNFNSLEIERKLFKVVNSIEGPSWDSIVEQLCKYSTLEFGDPNQPNYPFILSNDQQFGPLREYK